MPVYYVTIYGSPEGMKFLYNKIWLKPWCNFYLDGEMQFTEENLPYLTSM